MASVSVDDVRDVINVSSAEVPDSKITKMIKRAEVTLELETEKEIDYSNCTDAEKECITVLAAIYAVCYLTGGSAVGLSARMVKKNKTDKPTEEAKATDSPPIPSNVSPEKKVFQGKINKYGFIFLPKSIRESWGITKGVEYPLAIMLTAEGTLIIRKT